MAEEIRGTVASSGIVMGRIRRYVKAARATDASPLEPEDIAAELDRLGDALLRLQNRLTDVPREGVIADVRDAHLAILEDPYLIAELNGAVSEAHHRADRAAKIVFERLAAELEQLDDAYFRERASDYRDIGENLIGILNGMTDNGLAQMADDCIILANALTASDTIRMDRRHVLGLVDERGGKTSHASIIAQTLGIPALVGMTGVTDHVQDGDFAILDAESGRLILNPDPGTLDRYAARMSRRHESDAAAKRDRFAPAVTRDGRSIEVHCNIGGIEDMMAGMDEGAEGVGLFRTEMLFMDRDALPSEAEQFDCYRRVVEAAKSKPVTIRTLDIGGDKMPACFDFPKEANPFLGWRALRICFDRPALLKGQLRAILRASAFGSVRVLLPMIISVEELERVKLLIEGIKVDLAREGIAYDEQIRIGVMIETPASVMLASELIARCDFFSIGTNDLAQYMLAVDRDNDRVGELYNTHHPAVLRAIRAVIASAHAAGKPVGMCGAMAGDSEVSALLVGMGLDEFSCAAASVPTVKARIRQTDYEQAQRLAQTVLEQSTVEAVDAHLRAFSQEWKDDDGGTDQQRATASR